MYTQEPSFRRRTSYRKGFALILTLSALVLIIALTAVLIGYLDEARKDAGTSRAMIQGNLYYADIKKIFTGFKKKKSLYSTLYLSPVPLVTEDGRFSVMVSCKPLANAVNINWLAFENNESMALQYNAAQQVFDAIVQNYDLEDASKLEEMLLEEIGGKGSYVQKEQSRLRQKNGIISFKQFADILDRYQREADDVKIAQVPWEKFFVFNEVSKMSQENLIDGDYISAELLAVLFNIDIATVKEDWTEGTGLKTFVTELGGSYHEKLFAKDFLPQSQCDVAYTYAGERFRFHFADIDGEVKNFEFFGKQ